MKIHDLLNPMLTGFSGKQSKQSDLELLDLYRNTGDLKTLGVLYDRYLHIVYGICLKYLKDREDSQDAVMQIFEKLIREAAKHDVKHFTAWLYTLTKNYCLMQLRTKQSALEHMQILQKDADVFMETEEATHLDDGGALDADKERLQECIDQLKDHQRDCVILFYLEEKPYKEIGDLLDIDLKKVKSYIQNARRNLKNCMERTNG
jgi:RNA polymerase sigma-70 factor (ECF subfamily)